MPVPDRLADFTAAQLTDQRSLDFCRWLSRLHDTGGAPIAAAAHYLEKNPRSSSMDIVTKSIDVLTKAGVAAGTTTDVARSGPLATPPALLDAFLQLGQHFSIVPTLRTHIVNR